MANPESLSWSERFRVWYDYERDCNAKTLRMLASVPLEARNGARFQRAFAKMAHLLAARHMWLFRLGRCTDRPGDRFPETSIEKPSPSAAERTCDWFPLVELEDLPELVRTVEERWTAYLGTLTDADVAGDFNFTGYSGERRSYGLLDLLTQVFGHAWYHRGQIAMLVSDLGGEPVDTDYIFWKRSTLIAS